MPSKIEIATGRKLEIAKKLLVGLLTDHDHDRKGYLTHKVGRIAREIGVTEEEFDEFIGPLFRS